MKTTRHFESMYIILTDTGSFILSSYRPTDAYEGQKASDLPTLWKVPYLDNLSHELQIGQSVAILRNFENMVHPAKQSGVIVAKKQRYWDYSQPIGKREEITFVSEKWGENLSYYKASKQ